jgi:hypothetical protein
MVPADSSGNGGGRQRWQQAETKAVARADNNQPESGSNSSGGNGDCHGDGGSGGSSNGGNGCANSGLGGTNSGQGGGRCSRRRFHVDTNIKFLRFLVAKKAMI